jgi:predicted TIM-barrel fold metal-dependent hydrolase
MPYAEGRIFNDADSHFMETRDWIFQYADSGVRTKLAPMDFEACGGRATEELVAKLPSMIEKRRQDPAAMARAEANLLERKSWHALGGYDPGERTRALDLLGYNRQLVFTGMAMSHFWGVLGVQRFFDPEVLYGGARAHNRGIAEFCSHDQRMRAVGLVPLDMPELAAAEIRTAVKEGCAAIWVPATPPPTMSPTHPDMDIVWATLQDLDVPFINHLGTGMIFLREGFAKNGKTIDPGPLGVGVDDIRAKDYVACHYGTEAFMSAMILDGVLDKFPRLRGASIEQGAMWVVPWLKKLDIAQEAFKRFESYLNLPMKASDYVRRQLKFTPFPPEPAGWMIKEAGAELFLFSTDFPHPEGGRDPLKRYRAALGDYDIPQPQQDRFYETNFNELLGAHA